MSTKVDFFSSVLSVDRNLLNSDLLNCLTGVTGYYRATTVRLDEGGKVQAKN